MSFIQPSPRGWNRAWRWLRRGRAAPGAVEEPPAPVTPPPPTVLVDAGTRTWWRPGEARTETLVETVAARDDARLARRVAVLVAGSSASGRLRAGRAAGTSDPAFCELLHIELLRVGRFDRAWALLAPPCQAAWGSITAFAVAHADVGRRVAGARIVDVRALDTWEDTERGTVWDGVAELDVEYSIRTGQSTRPMRRTVHLVEVDGRWRTVAYPSTGA